MIRHARRIDHRGFVLTGPCCRTRHRYRPNPFLITSIPPPFTFSKEITTMNQFTTDEYVLAYHGPLLYEARVSQ